MKILKLFAFISLMEGYVVFSGGNVDERSLDNKYHSVSKYVIYSALNHYYFLAED